MSKVNEDESQVQERDMLDEARYTINTPKSNVHEFALNLVVDY